MANNKIHFHIKSFTSFLILFNFIILSFSGFALYIRPEGSIATWTGWKFIMLSKGGWEGLHTVFAVLFLVFVVLHIFLNWKILTGYLRNKAINSLRRKKEFIYAAALTGVIFAISVTQWQPAGSLIKLRKTIKHENGTITINPPKPDAEKMSISEIAACTGKTADDIIAKLKKSGIIVSSAETTLLQMAEQHNLSPEKLYSTIIKVNINP